MTTGPVRRLHYMLGQLRAQQTANSHQQAWAAVFGETHTDYGRMVVIMAGLTSLLNAAIREIRESDGLIDTQGKLAYLHEWAAPVYGWNWPGNGQGALSNYPRQEALDILDGIAGTLGAYKSEPEVEQSTRDSLLEELRQLHSDITNRVTNLALRAYLLDQVQSIIDTLEHFDINGATSVSDSATLVRDHIDVFRTNPRLTDDEKSLFEKVHVVVLKVIEAVGLAATIYLGIRNEPASAAAVLALSKPVQKAIDRSKETPQLTAGSPPESEQETPGSN